MLAEKDNYNSSFGPKIRTSATSTLKVFSLLSFLFIASFITLFPAHDADAANAGYSEFFVPGDEDSLHFVLGQFNGHGATGTMRAIISATAWQGNTTLYYDHWEDGYELDPNDLPGTADEIVTLANSGDINTFQTNAVPVPRVTAPDCNTVGVCPYDGRDRIISVGGAVTLSRASWDNTVGPVQAVAWEVYPVSPLLTTYIMPFGEDLDATGLQDFQRVFALIQATEGTTTITVDLNADGTPDTLCARDGTTSLGTSVSLALGEVFLLDRVSACNAATLNTGTRIDGNRALQVQYMIGETRNGNYEIRGLSAFPRGFWSKEYYAPVSGHATANTDIYIFNPQSTTLTVNWETTAGSGNFTIPATSTVSFQAATGSFVPQNSAVYLNANDVFWGISTIDTEDRVNDWGYSLVPKELLTPEHFLAWAPGSEPVGTGGDADNSGIFVTSAQDAIRVFVDYDNDGTVDQTYDLNRLQSQFIFDHNDGDMSNAHIWATGDYVAAYGQNPDNAPGGTPAIDVGYTMLPNIETETVLSVVKTTDPTVLPVVSGSSTTYTLKVQSFDFSVDAINVQDNLATGWAYVPGSTTITLADLSTSNADPVSGQWSSAVLGNLAPNQTITIVFDAVTTQNFNVGDVTRNEVITTGTRTVNSVTQTFTASDFAFNSFGDLQISKTSSVPQATPLSPGDTYTYTVTVTNPPGGSAYSNVAIYDPLPSGVTYVAASGSVSVPETQFTLDQFTTTSYANNDGNINWGGNWAESGPGNNNNPASGDIQVTGGQLQIGNTAATGIRIDRAVDLSSYSSATFSYDYSENGNPDNGFDRVLVTINDGLGNAITVFEHQTAGSGSISFTVPVSHLTAGFFIGFEVTETIDAGELRFFDNARINTSGTTGGTIVAASGNPPNFVTASDGYILNPGTSMTLTFDVTVDNPLANGINDIINTGSATATELLVPISASATNIVNNPGAGSATVGQRIWLDANSDGNFDVGETGLAGVEVTLRDDFGTPIDTTVTDSNGLYSFTGLPAGVGYYIETTAGVPGGLSQTTPAGPVANSTPKFNLINAQNYTAANIGYNSGSGTTSIGDLVWSDANGNGIQDNGEVGLGGVTVQLYQDVDSNGMLDPGTDTLLSSTTSAASGSYLFAGVTADGVLDYLIYVDPSQAAVTGYTQTTAVLYSLIDPLSSSTYMNADFGFQANGGGGTSTYSITERVWFDIDANGNDNGGAESGVAGITVDLLDASLNVVTTVTTDANGNFSFTGVADGNYTLRITDNANILVDYYGTTASAISGDLAVTVSGGNVSSVPSFGFNLTRSIGDTVFNDLNGVAGSGTGVQDPGEPGISGVVVELSNGSCTLGSTCPTVTTNASGTYLFSGLTPGGTYTVYIDGTQPALVNFGLTTADDGGAGSPHTRNVTLSGSTSNLTIDYGYVGTVPSSSISGTLWNDLNQDGVIDTGEGGLANVTVELENNVGTVVAMVTTDANGLYTFTGQPNGTYIVRVTDSNSVLNGYTQTYEVDTGVCGACNGETGATVSGSNVMGLNFGYYIPTIPTLVTLADFHAYLSPEGVIVEWETVAEQGTIGFWLERKDKKTKRFNRLNSELLPALALEGKNQGGTYQYIDTTAKTGEKYRYRLIEQEVWGTTKTYGPFKVRVSKSREDNAGQKVAGNKVLKTTMTAGPANTKLHDEGFKDAGKHFKNRAKKHERMIDRKAMKEARKAKRKAERKDKKAHRKSDRKANREFDRSFDGVTIAVRNAGLIHLDAAQLATELGLDLNGMQKLIKKGRLKLTNRGEKVRWQADKDNTGLHFYGEAIDSLYTLDNVYQLRESEKGKANTVRSNKARPSNRVDTDNFLHTEVVEKNVFAATVAAKDPEKDYWFEGALLAGNPSWSRKSFDLPLDDVIAGTEIIVKLSGATDDLHEVEIYLNGQLLGSGSWSGIAAYSLTLPISGQLNPAGPNTLEVALSGPSGNVIYYDRSSVSYVRATRAVGNQLIMTAAQRGNIRVNGFTDENIRVWDITKPRKPIYLSGTQINSDGGAGFTVRFASRAGHTYLAVADSAKIAGAAVALQAPDWGDAAEHLVISTDDLASSAQALVDYRTSSGIPSQLILIEDIYQRYNYGIADPNVIRTFLEKFARKGGSRYVVFAGSASFDYRDIMGVGDNFVPTLMTPTPFGLFACDSCLGDLDGDNYSDFIVSRIPATDDAGLLTYIEKLRRYESRNVPASALLLSDNDDPRAGAFKSDSESLVDLFPGNYLINRVYLDDYPTTADARAQMFTAFDIGLGHVNYIGHGGSDRLALSGLLTTTDMGRLSNTATPVVTALTCAVNRYEFPGFASLGEELVMDSDGGAIAIWAPSGLSFNKPAVDMNRKLLEVLYQRGQTRLGEAVDETLRTTPDVPEYMLRIYNIIGDAAVRVQ